LVKKEGCVRLLIISNRLPFSISLEEENIFLKPSSGGLISGISSYLDYMKNSSLEKFEYLWIGWPGVDIQEESRKKFLEAIADKNIVPVFVDENKMDKFYLGFCNSTIWPVFHYFPTLAKFESQHWEIYKEVNEIFAAKILEVANTDDIIWIHDYHLMLVPSIIRKKLGDNCKIGFFLHIPFPSFEVYRVMPRSWREEILKGLLGSDLIGFHTNEYSYSFLRCLLRILGISNNLGRLDYENRYIKVDTFPMGINFNKFDMAVEKEGVKTESKNIKNTLKDFKIILSVDRLDYTKGVPNRLKAFRKFLENNPQYLKKVVFILVIVPSRIGINEYDDLKNNLDKLISDINGKFQTMDWQPVIYQYRHIPFENLAALYYTSDIAMITPLRDGMNLVAKEYLASKKEAGVLILSEMAGAAKELGDAIIINPNDIDEMSETIKKALEMLENNTAEVNLKLKIMRERIKNYDVFRWVSDFIDTLDNIKASYRKLQVKLLNDNEKTKIIKDFKKVNKRIIFLDYDGTLVPFYGRAKEAIADSNLLKLLEQLSEICDVCVISGRDKNFIEKNIALEKIILSSEHGAMIREYGEGWKMLVDLEVSWKSQIINYFNFFRDKLPYSYVEEKNFSVAFHYRNSDPEMAEIRVKEILDELINYTSNLNLEVIQGNKVIEVRNYSINKSNAVKYLLDKNNYDFILAIGDDKTDEDVFEFLKDKNAYTLKVGFEKSSAKYNIENFVSVRTLLKELINA